MRNLLEVRYKGLVHRALINYSLLAASSDNAYELDEEIIRYLNCFLIASATCGNYKLEKG